MRRPQNLCLCSAMMSMRNWQRAIRDRDSSFCCGAEGAEKTMVVVWGQEARIVKEINFY